MRTVRIVSLICVLGGVLSLVSRAQAQLPMGWVSARSLGMGNAYTAVVDNGDAIFYNPAGLARVSGIHWTVLDPRAAINSPENLQMSGELNTSDVAAMIDKFYGKRIWGGIAGGKSAIWLPYFAVAAYQNSEVGAYVGSSPNTRLDLNYYFDYGGALGMAADLVPGFLSLGASVKYINRTGTISQIGPSTLAGVDAEKLKSEMQRRGVGYGVDFGALLRFPGQVSPSISFVYRDAGITSFSHEDGAGPPTSIRSEMLVGAGLKFDLPLVTITPAIDFRYVNWTGVATGLGINAGVEVSLPLLDLRAGMSQGYYTAGAGIDLGILQIDAATWAVELGAYPGQHPDRRYMAQVTLGFGFDAPTLVGGGAGRAGGDAGRRGMKRRR